MTTAADDVTARDVTVRFGRTVALEGMTATFPAGAITGLLGRNGSGKTTFLSLVGSLREPTSGRVEVGGRVPFENGAVSERVCLVRESGDVLEDETIATNLEYFGRMRPTWDPSFAEHLVDVFELDADQKVQELSRGQSSAVGAVVGLASRAPVTILDEVYLGMDAAIRQRFYDQLLADYVEHPRTYILSSHLISEVEALLEHVVVLHRGRMVLAEQAESLRSCGFTVVGPRERVEAVTREATVLRTRALGPTIEATILAEENSEELRHRALAESLEIGSVSIQDLVIHLTEEASS